MLEASFDIDAIARRTVLGNADAAWIEVRHACLGGTLLVDLYMRVAIDEGVSGCEWRLVVDAVVKTRPVYMTMRKKERVVT